MVSSGWWTVFAHPFDFTQYTLANYERVLTAEDMFEAFVNSLIVTIPATVIPITLAAFAAYAFAWTRFRGRSFLFAVVVGTPGDPAANVVRPPAPAVRNYDLTAPSSASGSPTPDSGFRWPSTCSTTTSPSCPRTYSSRPTSTGRLPSPLSAKLVIPLSYPALASFAILQFLWVWNDWLVSLVFLGTNPDVAVVTVGSGPTGGEPERGVASADRGGPSSPW